MDDIGQGFAAIFFLVLFFGIATGFLVVSFLDDDKIRSKTRIQPRIELTITNNQLDTLFVYEVK